MPAFIFHDWATQPTAALRLARLREHIAEVSALIADFKVITSSDGKSMTRTDLQRYLDGLMAQLKELETRATASASGGMSYARLNRVGSGGR